MHTAWYIVALDTHTKQRQEILGPFRKEIDAYTYVFDAEKEVNRVWGEKHKHLAIKIEPSKYMPSSGPLAGTLNKRFKHTLGLKYCKSRCFIKPNNKRVIGFYEMMLQKEDLGNYF